MARQEQTGFVLEGPDLKILILAYCVDKADTSEAQMAYNWIYRLSHHAELWVVTTGSRLHEQCGLEDLPNVHLVTLRPRFSFKWTGAFDRVVHPGYVEFYFRAKSAIADILSSQDIDLCHHLTPQAVRMPSPFHSVGCRYIVGPVHGGLPAPAVMNELEGREGLYFSMRGLDGFRSRHDPWLKNTYSNADAIVISAPYMNAVPPLQLCSRRILIPGTAVELPSEFNHHDRIGQSVRFMYAGRLVPSKGVELLIEALARCKKPGSVLSMYGTGEYESHYRNLAKERALTDRITWFGHVRQEEIYEQRLRFDAFVFPSLKEPAGIAPLEAMAAGLPVICVDAGGPGYAVTDESGIRVPLSSKDEMVENLAAAMDLIAGDCALRRRLGRNARLRVEQEFTWDAVSNKMVALYRELVS